MLQHGRVLETSREEKERPPAAGFHSYEMTRPTHKRQKGGASLMVQCKESADTGWIPAQDNPTCLGMPGLHHEKPLRWEVHTLQKSTCPECRRKACTATKTQHSQVSERERQRAPAAAGRWGRLLTGTDFSGWKRWKCSRADYGDGHTTLWIC